jgi:hypothetical protein
MKFYEDKGDLIIEPRVIEAGDQTNDEAKEKDVFTDVAGGVNFKTVGWLKGDLRSPF